MPDRQLPTKATEDDFRKADRLWGRMTFEVNLLTTRMNWLVSSQAFLFAAYFLALERISNGVQSIEALIFAVPIIGLMICLVTAMYVKAANVIVSACRDELFELKTKYPDQLKDEVDDNVAAVGSRLRAQLASKVLVLMFALFWVVAFLLLVSQKGS